MKLICVPPDRAAEAWPRVAHWIKDALRRADLGSYRGIENCVLSGRFLLWLAWDGKQIVAAAVTDLLQTEWRKVCNIVACGGDDMAQWIHLIEGLEDYARSESCAAISISGRKGWEKTLPSYRVRFVILEKAL